MSTVLHTEAIRTVFGADVDGDSASIAYQAEQLAQKLDQARAELNEAAKRTECQARDFAAGRASYAWLLSRSGVDCVALAARTEALSIGLLAMVEAAGKGKEYSEAMAPKGAK